MYQKHLTFPTVTDNTVVWRYLADRKFKSILEVEELYFSNAIDMQMLENRGGVWPIMNSDFSHRKDLTPEAQERSSKNFLKMVEDSKSAYRRVCLNFWYIGKNESEEMWQN